MAEKPQNLVDLVEPQGFLALLQITDKTQSQSGTISQIVLGHAYGLALGLHKLYQRVFHGNTLSGIIFTKSEILYPKGDSKVSF